MEVLMYQNTLARDVVPGDTIATDTTRLYVDEVSHRADGVALIGWPRPRTDGRRITARFGPLDHVRLVAPDERLRDLLTGVELTDGWVLELEDQ